MKSFTLLSAVFCLIVAANCNSPKKSLLVGSWQVVREDTTNDHVINMDERDTSAGKNIKTIYVFNEDHTVEYINIDGRDSMVEKGRYEISDDGKSLEISAEEQKQDTIHAAILNLTETSMTLLNSHIIRDTMKLKKVK